MPFRLGTVTGGTRGNIGLGKPLFKDRFSQGNVISGAAADGFGIQIPEMLGKSRERRGTEDVRDIEHDGVYAPAFNESAQLILDVFRLLPGESRHGKIAAVAFSRQAVASFAVFELRLESMRRIAAFVTIRRLDR